MRNRSEGKRRGGRKMRRKGRGTEEEEEEYSIRYNNI